MPIFVIGARAEGGAGHIMRPSIMLAGMMAGIRAKAVEARTFSPCRQAQWRQRDNPGVSYGALPI
jgi:hypothetical protein